MKFVFISMMVLASQAHASTTLNCNGMGSDKGESVKLEILNKSEVKVDGDIAKIDRSYNPRKNSDFLRFEYDSCDEGTCEVLVQSKLIDGEDRGMIKTQQRGEAFMTISYFCHP
jgi:hypothetical protein